MVAGYHVTLLHLSHCKQESIIESEYSLMKSDVSLPFWELLCTMANSAVSVYMHIQRDGSSPVQGVSAVDQYSHSVSMISSSSPLSVCGRRVGAERMKEHRKREMEVRWREGGRFHSQQWLREMFLPSI